MSRRAQVVGTSGAELDIAADAVAVAAAGVQRSFLSRALDPRLREKVADRGVHSVELPHVRGRTVVPDGIGPDTLVVVGRPNYLGRFDTAGAAGSVFVVADGSAASLEPQLEHAETIVIGATVPIDVATRAAEQTRLLVKRLRQLPGVTPAFMPSTPTAILLAAGETSEIAEASPRGTVVALSRDYPEFPGGLRISVPPGMARGEFEAYAASLQRAIDPGRRG